MNKERFHRTSKKILKDLAKAISLKKEDYEIRSDKGGSGVLGEVILHHKKLYMQIFDYESVMYRTCEGLKDYCGGFNRYCMIWDLENPQYLNMFAQIVDKP